MRASEARARGRLHRFLLVEKTDFPLIWELQSLMVWSDNGLRIMAREVGVAAFGEELRRAREERGMAVETICEATKVPAKHIRALEAGALAELPGGVFRKGFVRSYLGVLGLEETAWMKRFEDCCRESGMGDPGETDWVVFAENVKNNRAVQRRRKGFRRVMTGVLLLVLLAAGWCAWRVATHRRIVPKPMVWMVLNSWVDNGASR
jgi:transcriptional regulator with XRE-family HTH domain